MATRRTAHLFFPFNGEFGGSQMRAFEIARGLRERCGAEAHVWSTSSRIPDALRARGVRWFSPLRRYGAADGSFVFISSHWKPRRWLQGLRPRRLTVIINDMNVANFRNHLPLYRQIDPQARIAFTSGIQRHLFGADDIGQIDVSPIDLARFSPAPESALRGGPLRVGRHSRDTIEKHQFIYDPALYGELAGEGFEFDLMGATCIRHLVPESPAIRLRPAGAMDPADYLRSLDCFIYRTGSFYDTAARAVREAMACGLPVLCHRFGGHIENIVHGENGFIFDEQREAAAILRSLRDDAELRRRIGANARRTMEELFAPARLQAMLNDYLG
jgi:hypothetical protein